MTDSDIPVFDINPDNSLKDGSPAMTITGSGKIFAAYQSEISSGEGFEVFLRQIDGENGPVGNAIGLGDDSALLGGNARIETLADGSFIVAWVASGHILAQRFGADGQILGSIFTVVEARDNWWEIYDFDITADPLEGFTILYSFVFGSDDYEDVHDSGIRAVKYLINDATSGTNVKAEGFSSGGGLGVDSTTLADGRLVVTDGYNIGVFEELNDSDLGSMTATGNFLPFPSVASLADGNFVVVAENSSYFSDNIYFHVFDASEELPESTDFTDIANSYRLGEQTQPSVAALRNGGFVIVWQTDRYGNKDIEGQIFDANGVPVGGGFSQEIQSDATDGKPVVLQNTDGDIQLAWQSNEDGDLDVVGAVIPIEDASDGEYIILDDQRATGKVTVDRLPVQGTEVVLQSTIDDPDGIVSMTYQWFWQKPSKRPLYDAIEIPGATEDRYTPTQAAVDYFLAVQVIIVDEIGQVTKFSTRSGQRVLNVNDPPDGSLDINGKAFVGSTITAVPNFTDLDGLGPLSYQWFRDGNPVIGETSLDYKVLVEDVGYQLQIKAFYTDGYGFSETITSMDALWKPTENDDVLWGTPEADRIDALAGNDTIDALAGDDTIFASDGADILVGGIGKDFMNGGPGGDIYYVDNTGDVVVESARWLGTDLVYSSVDFLMGSAHVENLFLTDTAIKGVGNGLENEIRGNAENNILDGGKNNDVLMGGAGNDTYFVRAPGDTVIEAAGRGTADTVKAFRDYELPDNVERLYAQTVYTKDGNPALFNAIGNTEANTIVGTPFENTIIGRQGNDTLKGQTGADTFVFDRALGNNNVDRLIDFNTNEVNEGDILKLKSSVFGGIESGILAESRFVVGTSAQDDDDRLIFDQASGRLWFDADGSGATAQVLFATFEQNAIVEASDILIF